MKACCEEFEKYAGKMQSVSPMAIGYAAAGMKVTAQFEQDTDGERDWNINGCCGGGCYVVTGMKFCPFCGSSLRRNGKQ